MLVEREGEVGVIQIDIEMPKNCIDCPACNEYLMCAIPVNGRGWGENDVREYGQGRPEWCPMKEQKEMLKEQEARVEQLKRFVNGFSRDAMPIVRCKDCKHRLLPTGETRAECMARAGWFPVDDDWYCADGERK